MTGDLPLGGSEYKLIALMQGTIANTRPAYAGRVTLRQRLDRAFVPFGIIAVLVSMGSGYLIVEHLEGLNADWPIWVASVVPIVFILGGLFVLANGLGYAKLSAIVLTVFALCLGVGELGRLL